LIRSVEPERLSEYKIAKWMDRNRRGERAFIAGSSSFLYNVFTDNPQFQGGHIQFAVNRLIPGAVFQIQSGTDAGSRGTEVSVE
jgi:oxalate decarboxylase/phosphoglucose isomerase-like protein (cupin superfamily)